MSRHFSLDAPSTRLSRWPLNTLFALGAALLVVSGCASTGSDKDGDTASAPKPPPPVVVAAAPPVKKQPQVQLVAEPTWRPTVTSEKDFLKMSKKVGNERYVKALLDVRDNGGVFYFDVNVYNVHIEFAYREFYTDQALTPSRRAAFNKNYEKNKPDFILVTLVNHLDSDIWTFSFWEGDQMTGNHVASAHKRIASTFFMGPKLRFRPASPRQERLAKELAAVPHITNDSIYKLSTQHTFNAGRRVGILRLVKKGQDYNALTFKPSEIVILQEPIPEITAVSGIISEQFSTPLAHVNLRAAAWGIPHIGLRNASKTHKKLIGKPVLFHAKEDGFELRKATKEEAELITTKVGRKAVAIPRADLKRTQLGWLPEIRATQTPVFGAKAANLGEIAYAKIPGVLVPLGFGVPIAHYDAHMKRNGLNEKVDALLKDKKLAKDGKYRREKLAELRKAIETAPLDPKLVAEVDRRITQLKLKPGAGVFVRSSTNAEDLPGFTGAGLYTTVPNVKGSEDVGKAIRKVWASIWNFRAFEERVFHAIDHRTVYAAVLIQTGVNATAAGVLITTNIFDTKDSGTYTINAKKGLGMRVVGGKKIPEQLLYNPEKRTIKVLSRSDETTMLVFDEKKGGVREVETPKGKPVLDDKRVIELGVAAQQITKLFPKAKALDIEWLLEGNNIQIVQARPFVTR